jgi:putative membrane protein
VTAADVPESADPSLGWLGIYVRGLCMGTADAIPGVSGGTIAMIVGIYERLIAAVTSIDPGRVLRVLRGLVSDGRADAWAAVREMDALFLLALGAGIATAIVTVTRIAHWAITEVPVATFGLFFGFIGASALVLYTEVGLDTWPERIAALAGVVLAFVVSGRAATALESSPALTFFAGALAVSAMILPGISGSLLLVLIGQYEFMTGSLAAFVDALVAVATGAGLETLAGPGATVVFFLTGAVVGLLTVAHAIRWALATYREPTLAFLVSLIVGALRAPVVQTELALAEAGRGWTPTVLATFVITALVGVVLVVVVDRFADGIEY